MRRDLEHLHQVALFNWAGLMIKIGKHPDLACMYAVPNAGKRTRRQGARMKAEGLKAGVPDVALPVPRGGFHGMYIEMKIGKNTLEPNQREWFQWLAGQGFYCVVCWGWEQAQKEIERYLALPLTEVA